MVSLAHVARGVVAARRHALGANHPEVRRLNAEDPRACHEHTLCRCSTELSAPPCQHRCRPRRCLTLPLGSGALAGNPFKVDRQFLADELGFEGGVCPNSMDAVSDRDYAIETVFWQVVRSAASCF